MDANEQAIRAKYLFIDVSISLMPQIYANVSLYDSPSCGLISRICNAGMKTTDILMSQPDTQSISVQRLLGSLYEIFWSGYVSFAQQENIAQGSRTISLTSDARSILSQYTSWDEAFQGSPFSHIGDSMYDILRGVTV